MIFQHVEEGVSFSDVILKPKPSEIKSRSEVKIIVDLPKGYTVSPILPANMASIIGKELAQCCLDKGSLVLLHRFCSPDENIKLFNELSGNHEVGVSIGIGSSDYDIWRDYHYAGIRICCIDVAHAGLKEARRMTARIANDYPDTLLIAGNVCDSTSTCYLFEAGADIVKVGVGNGAACRTQDKTGCGAPQLSSLAECAYARDCYKSETGRDVALISDGGIRSEGDCVKALCFADLVMMGKAFAETVEAPNNGEYRGSSTHKSDNWEGYILPVEKKRTVADVYKTYHEGIRSGCSYLNAKSVADLKKPQQWIKVSK